MSMIRRFFNKNNTFYMPFKQAFSSKEQSIAVVNIKKLSQVFRRKINHRHQ
jgi:hypothetical protein